MAFTRRDGAVQTGINDVAGNPLRSRYGFSGTQRPPACARNLANDHTWARLPARRFVRKLGCEPDVLHAVNEAVVFSV